MMNEQPNPAPDTQDSDALKLAGVCGYDRDHLLLIGRNRRYYLTRFRAMQERRSAVSLNLSALLLGPFWLLYRKMQFLGLILLLAEFTPLYVHSFLFLGVILAIAAVLGLFGNDIYRWKIERVVRKNQAAAPEWKHGYLQIIGGTSLVPIFLALALCVLSALALAAKGVMPVLVNDLSRLGGN